MDKKDKALLLLPALPWFYLTIAFFIFRNFSFSGAVNLLSLLFVVCLLLTAKVLQERQGKYYKYVVLLIVSYASSFLFSHFILLAAAVVAFFLNTLRPAFGTNMYLELAGIISVPVTYGLFFYNNSLIIKQTNLWEKIAFFWLMALLVYEALLTTMEATTSIDGWVEDSMRSITIVACMVAIFRYGVAKYLPNMKIKKALLKSTVIFSCLVVLSFVRFVFEIHYNLQLSKQLDQHHLLVKHLVTQDLFSQDVAKGKLKRIEEYQKILGAPDASVSSYEYLRSGEIINNYYCYGPDLFNTCRGYQITIKDEWVTSTLPYWGPHEWKYIKEYTFENWLWNRFFGFLPFKNFS